MANAWAHPNLIAAEALNQMSDNLLWGQLTTRDITGQFVNSEMKIGETVQFRTTPDYEAKSFNNDGINTIERQAIRSGTLPFTIGQLFDVSVEITNREKVLDLDSFTEQVIGPAAVRLAEKVDRYIAEQAYAAYTGIYASNELFGTVGDMALARAAANYRQLNKNGRFCLVGGSLESRLLGKDYFYNASIRGDGENLLALREGFMARTMGFDFFSELNSGVDDAVGGTSQGTAAAVTDNDSGASNLLGTKFLKLDDTTGITPGDTLVVAGMRRNMRVSNVVSATLVELVFPIMEIVPDAAAVTVAYATETLLPKGLMFDSRAMGLAMPPLGKPSDKPSAVISSNGYSIRIVQGYDMEKKVETLSLDTMVGAGALDPRRITLLADLAP